MDAHWSSVNDMCPRDIERSEIGKFTMKETPPIEGGASEKLYLPEKLAEKDDNVGESTVEESVPSAWAFLVQEKEDGSCQFERKI